MDVMGFNNRAPVFIVGCPRSGTTLLGSYLRGTSKFAAYRAEADVFPVLRPAFGDLKFAHNRKKLVDRWLRSRLFQVSGLEPDDFQARVMSECLCEGDFLRIQMEQIASRQGLERWFDKTPDNLLYIHDINRQIPGSLFIHIIRDGRDVALSYSQMGWSKSRSRNCQRQLLLAGAFWQWIVRRGRADSQVLGSRYLEVQFEHLIEKPRETLSNVGAFIGERLDYDDLRGRGVGSPQRANTSFPEEINGGGLSPVGRWKRVLTDQQLGALEAVLGDYLSQLGYACASMGRSSLEGLRTHITGKTYGLLFDTKHWLKSNTPLGRLVDLSRIDSA